MTSTPNMDVIKEIPGYKVIVKAILKSQIQQLVEQLASTTDEECVILTASLTDGSLSHLGSDFGKGFIEDHQDIKSQFLSFCLKKRNNQKQEENKRIEAEALDAVIQDTPVGRSQRSQRSGSLQISPDKSNGSMSLRFEPYPMTRSRMSAKKLNSVCETSQRHGIKELNEHIVKVEPNDENDVSNLSVSYKQSTPSDVTTNANMKISVNDYLAQETSQSLVDYDTDSAFDETLPCLSVKLEAIAETLKTFAEHDSELEYEDTKSMGTVPETKSEIKGLGPLGAVHGKEPEATGIECIETVHETEQGITGVEPLMLPIPNVPNVLIDTKFDPSNATVNQEVMSQSGTNRSYLTECDNTEQSFQSRTTLQTYDTNPVICNKCGKTFNDSNFSTITPGKHTKVKPFHCETCSSTCSVDGAFNKLSAKKSEKNQHECDRCGKCFPSKSRLNRHLSVHTGIKPFKCETCGKLFPCKWELTRHIVIQSGIKPFKCDLCGKLFSLKWQLTSHLASHSGVKPFKCDICGKSFPKKEHLTRHLARHLGI